MEWSPSPSLNFRRQLHHHCGGLCRFRALVLVFALISLALASAERARNVTLCSIGPRQPVLLAQERFWMSTDQAIVHALTVHFNQGKLARAHHAPKTKTSPKRTQSKNSIPHVLKTIQNSAIQRIQTFITPGQQHFPKTINSHMSILGHLHPCAFANLHTAVLVVVVIVALLPLCSFPCLSTCFSGCHRVSVCSAWKVFSFVFIGICCQDMFIMITMVPWFRE